MFHSEIDVKSYSRWSDPICLRQCCIALDKSVVLVLGFIHEDRTRGGTTGNQLVYICNTVDVLEVHESWKVF